MKKIIFVLVVSVLFTANLLAQTKTGIELCIEYQKAFSSFASEKEANVALDKILDVIGASKNFTLIPCDDISNAVAVTFKGDRFIIYDAAFMRKIDQATNNWSYLFILAHEVGHHINGHTRDFLLAEILDDQPLEDRRKEELEADEFASFIVSKLGASYSQIEETIALVASDKSDLYSTHPNYDKRIAAVKRGFERAASDLEDSKEDKSTFKRNYNYSQSELVPNLNNPREDIDSSFGEWYVTKSYPFEQVMHRYWDTIDPDPWTKKNLENTYSIRDFNATTTGVSRYDGASEKVRLNISLMTLANPWWSDCFCELDDKKTHLAITLEGWEDHPKEVESVLATFEYAIDDKYSGQFITRIQWLLVKDTVYEGVDGRLVTEKLDEPYSISQSLQLDIDSKFTNKENFEFVRRLREGEKLYLKLGRLFDNKKPYWGENDKSYIVDKYSIPRYIYEFDLSGFSEAISF